jgi:hypothetical protein
MISGEPPKGGLMSVTTLAMLKTAVNQLMSDQGFELRL